MSPETAISIFNGVVLLGVAALNAYSARLGYRTHETTQRTNTTANETKVIANETKAIAQVTEKNTNSLTVQLVDTTRQMADAAGHERGRLEGVAKAAADAAKPQTE